VVASDESQALETLPHWRLSLPWCGFLSDRLAALKPCLEGERFGRRLQTFVGQPVSQ
jgi:hypothetical protein